MRKFALPFALVVVLASAVAIAAPDKIRDTFSPLTAQGISGDISLNPMKQGGTRIQAHLDNLEPNTDYVSTISASPDDLCTGGVEFVSFTSNPAGKAVFNALVGDDVSTIGSISVRRADDPLTNQACADLQ